MWWKNKKKEANIQFTCDKHLVDVLPPPVPAVKTLPEWFKKCPNSYGPVRTAKRCVPMLDAMSLGFTLPLWADLRITVTEDDYGKRCSMEMTPGFSKMDSHNWEQVGEECTTKKYEFGRSLNRLMSPWVIKASPGYSVYFKNPANDWSNDIEIFEGIIDADTYAGYANLVFVWKSDKCGEWIIPAGTPIAQLIPFKRDELTMSVGEIDMDERHTTQNKLGIHFNDAYRKLFWHKRKQ